jgi:glycosyltransferase involved in cell wall biosynthesis
MRILLASPHRYPAFGRTSSGLHPRSYPSGSGYHLHDLLAQGLAEEGNEVLYFVEKGAELPMPFGVTQVSSITSDVDIIHAPIGPPGFAEKKLAFAATHGIPCLLTCHMLEHEKPLGSNWVFVSRSLAQAYGSSRFVVNGINPDDFIFSETKQDYLLFLCAMNRAADKGLDLALQLSQSVGFHLVVAGTGLNYDTIRQVSELCADAGAEYVGDVRGSQKAELIAGARALLFPSRLKEGCPLTILEALVSGTPVISSRSSGTEEVLAPDAGILCDREEDWRAALDRIGRISPIRCREIVLEKYHYRRMANDYLREYRVEISLFNTL